MNYRRGDAFQANLDALFSFLSAAAAASSGFAMSTAGGAAPDQAYGLAQCRGDVSVSDCRACLNHTAHEMAAGGSACASRRNAMLVHEGCLLRYSNASFFGAPYNGDPIYEVANVQNNAAQPERFASRLSALLSSLKSKAAYGSLRMFAIGAVGHTPFVTIYGMARCTWDTAADDCNICLDIVVKTIPKCCSGKEGGRVFARSCLVRFEVYRFYNEETAEAAMAPALPPASGGGRVNGSDLSGSPRSTGQLTLPSRPPDDLLLLY
ncbi:putative receptor-like protein kinase [Panicum miliaceum]|uniref:Receptor-like protein kinase n=1 Tax=Panicum miliaceum TaxID=4540 RepID=A0A3L6QWS4_PANMI|nr:putative receptor-like protein kinase [Panicum miliaceum]